ncbi:Aste57867_11939 [Aphanomyces stellatus]|uniref:Aste57867_11939 protein n=1 Tax=Aphanomyces stellatus TaxID=120398 RepID=A0A485KUP4_9STRA|nr:hypothetical protein As57867_011894 [Aphanomyces stellatus]VFT88794.1 Aste57867_11939 [Aphanomyces stellatus]
MTKLICAARDDPSPRVSSGPQMKLLHNVFQGFVLPAYSSADVPSLVQTLQKTNPRLRHSTHLPYAFRIVECADGETTEVVEGGGDGGILGAGDKLLQVLRRWEVCNAVVVVNRADRSLTGRLIVAQTYKLVVESAKLALEQFALESLHPTEAAKLALQDLAQTNQDDGAAPPHLTVQEMTYAGQATNMVNGMVQGTKQGRVNHFQAAAAAAAPLDTQDDTVVRLKSLDAIGISKDDLATLKALRMPPKELHMVLVCVALLLNVKDVSWIGCREMLHHPAFCARVLHLDPIKLSKKQAARVRAILQEPEFVPELVRRISAVGAALLTWVFRVMDDYDAHRLGFELRGPDPIDDEDDNEQEHDAEERRDDEWTKEVLHRRRLLDDEAALRIDGPEPHPPPPQSVADQDHAIIPTDLFHPKTDSGRIRDHGRMV